MNCSKCLKETHIFCGIKSVKYLWNILQVKEERRERKTKTKKREEEKRRGKQKSREKDPREMENNC
jgi:hypothetical protein